MLRLDNISQQYGRQILFWDTSMNVFRGDRVGLVGANGSGKSTIFRMLAGQEQPDGGRVVIERDVTIGYFDQDVGEMSGRTVVQETMAGAGPVAEIGARLAELETAMGDPKRADELDVLVEEFGDVQARFDELDGYALDARAREILAGLSFRPDSLDEDVSKLSGGWKMRVALARILLLKPDALLLDEPTNHLDLESIIWLEQFLKGFEGALVITSHDREFLNRLVTKVVEIDSGELTSFTGDFDNYEQQRALLTAQSEAQFARQQAMLKKEEAFIARFKARASHATQVQSRVKKLEKIERVEPPKKRKVVRFDFAPAPRSGDDVVKLKGVHKCYGKQVIYRDLDLLIRRGERICVMGVNGAGKSTLLKLITGTTEPDSGEVSLGVSVKLGYFAQHAMELLDPKLTVLETLQGDFPRANLATMRTLAGAFGFSGDEVDKKCSVLSGGEKARLVLARLLFDPPNLLVLDEPTNHLDLDTKAMLMKALSNFEGTMAYVSHDRDFLSALSNRVVELRPNGMTLYEGSYSEYVQQSGHEAPGLNAGT